MFNDLPKSLIDLSRHAFDGEDVCVQRLLGDVEPFRKKSEAIFKRAKTYVKAIRDESLGSGIEAFIHQFGLQDKEGVAILCLAEALLRIPDSQTADVLIADKLEGTDFLKHLGHTDSLFLNASTFGLMLTESVIDMGNNTGTAIIAELKRAINRLGEPVIREALKKAMALLGSQFVIGTTIEQAKKNSRALENIGYRFSFDMLGEGARSDAQARDYLSAYTKSIHAIGSGFEKNKSLHERPSISIKLSALHPRYELLKVETLRRVLLPRLESLAILAKNYGIAISIDAEESARLDISLLLYENLLSAKSLQNYSGLGFVVQAYQKRGIYVIEYLSSLAKKYGTQIPVRLVKGAYWDSEIKRAQVEGLPDYPVFTEKSHTDLSYMACASLLIRNGDVFYPQFATHNALTAAAIIEVAGKHPFEFQRLYGMGDALYTKLVGKYNCRIYAPVGAHQELLPYLIRRLMENTANTSFVHLVVDKDRSISDIVSNPIEAAKNSPGLKTDISLPKHIFGNERDNSIGLDFGNISQLIPYDILLSRTPAQREISTTSQKELVRAAERAKKSFLSWNNLPVHSRTTLIKKVANLLEENHQVFVTLLMQEAGKTLRDAVAEIREAVDFCRYYAYQAENLMTDPTTLPGPTGESNVLSLRGKGVFACISPWNFPLAIFIGQIVAALVTGNTVLAKPAEETPHIAAKAVKLFHQAGIPKDVLHLVLGDGKTGAQIVKAPEVIGTVFTGSTETARKIAAIQAAKNGPINTLIAETGGQNAMIIDSSSLLEQAVDDVITSAFGSAGQRCSALRVVYVQKEIAKNFVKLMQGAIDALIVGKPDNLATDIGPVISKKAKEMLEFHIAAMRKKSKLIAIGHAPKIGNYVAPHLFEIRSIKELKREVFGPVLHLIRFDGNKLEKIVEEINDTGYGLTFGLHSRINSRMEYLKNAISAGNIYVNRSIIGAVVGVQPFGGHGLSGTGPKAGGPHFLYRFVQEKTYTVNTAAIGGNVELLK